jgi:hypothetical protein
VANRERRRTERRKRKSRSAPAAAQDGFAETYRERSEARNQAARDSLEPLEEGERPGPVTIGAAITALLGISGIVLFAAGVEVNGSKVEAGAVLPWVFLMWVMAWGMWRARYWAVLGFQALLALLIISASLGLVQATKPLQAVATGALVIGAGYLFWRMVKAMARIQMPSPHPRDDV